MIKLPQNTNGIYWDVAVLFGCLTLSALILLFWLPYSAHLTDPHEKSRHIIAGMVGIVGIFLALAVYGAYRFSAHKRRCFVLGIVAIPALYAGVIMGDLRANFTITHPLPDGFVSQHEDRVLRAQAVLAALWWGEQSALALPKWSRGGREKWPTLAGNLFVQTNQNDVRVNLPSSSESVRECRRLLYDLASQSELFKKMGGEVLLNGRHVSLDASSCQKGDTLVLIAPIDQNG